VVPGGSDFNQGILPAQPEKEENNPTHRERVQVYFNKGRERELVVPGKKVNLVEGERNSNSAVRGLYRPKSGRKVGVAVRKEIEERKRKVIRNQKKSEDVSSSIEKADDSAQSKRLWKLS